MAGQRPPGPAGGQTNPAKGNDTSQFKPPRSALASSNGRSASPSAVASIESVAEALAATFHGNPANLSAIEQRFLRDLRLIRRGLAESVLTLPVKKYGYPGWQRSLALKELTKIPGFVLARSNLVSILFDGWRPGLCQKPPMAAPNPGMKWAGEIKR
jgi:hypothetical protein